MQRFWHKNMRLKSNTFIRAHISAKNISVPKKAPHSSAAPGRNFRPVTFQDYLRCGGIQPCLLI